jgi:pectinesterase
MNCELGNHIVAQGWHNWGNKDNEQTARYLEYNNSGPGAVTNERAAWSRQLTKNEVKELKENFFVRGDNWKP